MKKFDKQQSSYSLLSRNKNDRSSYQMLCNRGRSPRTFSRLPLTPSEWTPKYTARSLQTLKMFYWKWSRGTAACVRRVTTPVRYYRTTVSRLKPPRTRAENRPRLSATSHPPASPSVSLTARKIYLYNTALTARFIAYIDFLYRLDYSRNL